MKTRETTITQKYQSRFWRTKGFLYRVRDTRRKIDLLERRIDMREGTEQTYRDIVPVSDLQMQLTAAQEELKFVTMVVTDMVGMLEDVNQQTVITKRYLDKKTWDQIAVEMDMSLRSVHKFHGQALPILEQMLFGDENDTDAGAAAEAEQTDTE